MRVCVILAAGGPRQNTHFFPSYNSCEAGIPHDLVACHRNMLHVQDRPNVKWLNKIVDGVEVPHAAFGAYRFGYQQNPGYDLYVFFSDDVVLRRDCWLYDIVERMSIHPKVSFGASQIFNGGKRYPEATHLRAPFWFAKGEALASINWEFNGDHDGEMRIGDQLANAGWIGVQVGNKLNLGYDVDEENHVTQLLERRFYPGKSNREKFDVDADPFKSMVDEWIISPYGHIGRQHISDIEPFDGLIYRTSLELAKQYLKVKDYGHDTYCI